jgi:hypothetical protein
MFATAVGPMIRAHWAIENSLHWVMDTVFRDDECRVRRPRVRIPSASGAKPQAGTMSISPSLSPREILHSIPLCTVTLELSTKSAIM